MSDTPSLTPFVTINTHNIALLFAQYLNSQHITCEVKQAEEGFVLYCDPNQINQAKTLFEEFIQQPNNPKYQQSAWQSNDTTQVKRSYPSLLSEFKRQFIAGSGTVTTSVFLIIWAVFASAFIFKTDTLYNLLMFYGVVSIDSFLANPLKLIGPAFIHFHGFILFLIPCGGGS